MTEQLRQLRALCPFFNISSTNPHHVTILTMNGDSYRLKESAGRRRAASKVGAEQN